MNLRKWLKDMLKPLDHSMPNILLFSPDYVIVSEIKYRGVIYEVVTQSDEWEDCVKSHAGSLLELKESTFKMEVKGEN